MNPRGLILALCAVLLGGCTHTLALSVPAQAPLKVVVRDGPHYTLDPSSRDYQRLSQWVEGNRSGWHVYWVTAPQLGVGVDGGDWHLNFLGPSVLATTPQGTYTKRVDPKDYDYLRQPHAGS